MSAATDWANKRKAQIARAEQLRAQRKAGISSDDGASHSFKPTLQARPKYLDEQHSFAPQVTKKAGYNNGNNNGDSLDNLADNIFEQPLPGNRGAKATKALMYEGSLPSGAGGSGKQLSPSSDALGAEMRRYGGNESYSGGRGNGDGIDSPGGYHRHAHHGAPTGDPRYDEGDAATNDYRHEQKVPRERAMNINTLIGDSGYKSKFMQQYESPAPHGDKHFFPADSSDPGRYEQQQRVPPRQQQKQQYRDDDDYDEPCHSGRRGS